MSTKIERIMQQLEDGTYNVSSQKIAEKLLKKNPKLSDKVPMETKIIGNMKGFTVTEYMDEGFEALIAFEFRYNYANYGKYLLGVYSDGSTVELANLGEHYLEFDDDGLIADAFEEEVEDLLIEHGLV